MRMVLLLIGPKGAGKTHAGVVLEQRRIATFVRVEPIFLKLLQTMPKGPEWERAGYNAVVDALVADRSSAMPLVIESTAASNHFPDFLATLRSRFDVRLIAFRVPLDECKRRVLARDSAQHIPVSDHLLDVINAAAARVALPFDAELDNTKPLSEDDIVAWFERLIAAP